MTLEGISKLIHTSHRSDREYAVVAHVSNPRPTLELVTTTTISRGGVTFHADRKTEHYYIDVTIDHEPHVLQLILKTARMHGFEPDDLSTDEMNAEGTIRSYLLEVTD